MALSIPVLKRTMIRRIALDNAASNIITMRYGPFVYYLQFLIQADAIEHSQ